MSSISAPQPTTLPHRSTTQPQQPQLLPSSAKPPKSKTEPYYSIHPSWTDLVPIPQMDLEDPTTYTSPTNTQKPLSEASSQTLASAGPALALISYTPRYVEAMSYLRSIMALNEYSDRALLLTEDIISMNPAHYTVWIYRFRVLRELWGPFVKDSDEGIESVNEKAKMGFDEELKWLDRISEKNLKNYQIWHHRQSLFQLLPQPPITQSPSQSSSHNWILTLLSQEPHFLSSILSLDTKNYHVWSYRQWLCSHFSSFFLSNPTNEINAMTKMISEDVLNNSAWNHRYFVLFGHQQKQKQKDLQVVDMEVVEGELEYVKKMITLAPQNGSSWNYLKGLLKVGGIPVGEMKGFVEGFVGDGFKFDVLGSDSHKGVRSSQAVEMSVEIFAKEVEGGFEEGNEKVEDAKQKVRDGLGMLCEKWDPIRRRYWEWRLDRYESRWKEMAVGGS